MQMARRTVHKQKKRAEQNEIEREMRCEAPVFAGVTETAARDVEAANLRGDRGDDEDRDDHGQDRQSTEIKTTRDERRSAKVFQPGQIKYAPPAKPPSHASELIEGDGENDWSAGGGH